MTNELNHLTKQKKWRRKQMNKDYIINSLRKILREYHYDSKEQHMSKDVVTSLENLLGSLLK
jgi:hypothetical protein